MKKALVTGKRRDGNLVEFVCKCPEIAKSAVPGQFVMISVSTTLDPFLNRPLGILWAEGDYFSVLFEIVGRGTSLLAQLEKGDTLSLLGPLGNGYSLDVPRALLLAGGRGIVTLHFLARTLKEIGISISMLFGIQNRSEIVLSRYMVNCAKGVQRFCCEEEISGVFQGTIVDALEDYATVQTIPEGTGVFACGPEGMLRALARHPLLENHRVEVSLEAVMGCGFGVCLSCAHKGRDGYLHVCSEGPVFPLSEVAW